MTTSLTVEVDLALSRPPRADVTVWVEVAIEPGKHWADAAEAACQIATCTRRDVVMPVGYRIIDWTD